MIRTFYKLPHKVHDDLEKKLQISLGKYIDLLYVILKKAKVELTILFFIFSLNEIIIKIIEINNIEKAKISFL